MIELIPAIDIINGQCVRLTKGDYDQKTVYGEPLDMALEFERIGFQRLHMVDLDGAKSKHVVNCEVLCRVTTETQLTVDFGGGIKTDEDLEKAFCSRCCDGDSRLDRSNESRPVYGLVRGIWC